MLKHSLLTMAALIGLASAVLPLIVTHAEAGTGCSPCSLPTPPPPPPPPPPNNNKPGPGLIDDPNYNPDGSRKGEMLISCKIPRAEETKSVVFRNIGQKLIPSGTPVTWYIKITKQGGKFSLPHDLATGGELTAAELLKLGVPGNASCFSKL